MIRVNPQYLSGFGKASPGLSQAGSVRFAKQAAPLQSDLFLPVDDTQVNRRFVVLGDTGSANPNQRRLMRQVKQLYGRSPFGTALILGDNVYGGTASGNHPMDGSPRLFRSRIRNPFKPLMDKGVKFFPILGNHDVRTNLEDKQLRYWGDVPRYYQFKRGNVEFFAIDTTLYLPGYDGCYTNNRSFAKELGDKQLKWLDTALSQSQSKYKVVLGHYPMYSSGKFFNRGRNADQLRGILQLTLVKHQVDAYLCGHDHHYERSKEIYGIRHFLSGGGSKIDAEPIAYLENPPYPREVVAHDFQFMEFEEKTEGLTFNVINAQGKIIDAGLISPKNKSGTAPSPRFSGQLSVNPPFPCAKTPRKRLFING